jgi:hypothetical protein
MNLARRICLGIIISLLAFPAIGPAQDTKRRVNITIGQFPTETEMLAWTAYGVSLGDWVRINRLPDTAPEGPFIPTFESELHARQLQLKIWREASEKRSLSLKYMDELQLVEKAGFIREYLWQHHHRETWGAPPGDLRVKEFLIWQSQNIPRHTPQTGARIVFGPPVRQ